MEPEQPQSDLERFFSKPLEEQAAELRSLAERIGALPPPRPPRAFSPLRTFVEAFVLTGLALVLAWFLWHHWHSVLAATLPLVIVVARAFRWRPPSRPSRRGEARAQPGSSADDRVGGVGAGEVAGHGRDERGAVE